MILDHYVFGDVERISPEAPVPVVHVKEESFRLGGATNACANICSLDASVDIIGIVGRDGNGKKLIDMLKEIGANLDGLIFDGGRPTIIKTRVIAQHQQMVRIDRESKLELNGNLKKRMFELVKLAIEKVDAVIISDYDKGVVTKELIEVIVSSAKKRNIPTIVDPKEKNFWNYKDVTVITPNLKEASTALGIKVTDEEDLISVGNTLLERLQLSALLITRGENGMSLFESVDGIPTKVTHIPTVAREVFDVTGAGDTVAAVFTLALAAKASMLDAAKIANCAAGIVVGELGTGSVTQEELTDALKEMETEGKFCE